MMIIFFKQKTAYEIVMCLEFRRVLFRSKGSKMRAASSTDPACPPRRPRASSSPSAARTAPGPCAAWEIGRASCREGVWLAEAAEDYGKRSTERDRDRTDN